MSPGDQAGASGLGGSRGAGGLHGLGVEPDSVLDGPGDLGLATSRVGRRVHYLRAVDSTNTALALLAQRGAEPGTVLIADEQTGGRGRSGRTWFSPARSAPPVAPSWIHSAFS